MILHPVKALAVSTVVSGGKPQDCNDLMQHLIEQGVIRFIDGVWALPRELTTRELPAEIGQALDQRIDRLSADALRLALALSVHRGPISIERCLALAELERVQAPFRALIELEQRGVMIASEDRLRFSHASVREAALRKLPEIGYVPIGDRKTALKYARVRPGASPLLVLGSDRPIFFVGGGAPDAKPRAGFEVGVIELDIDAKGNGKGTMAGAARVKRGPDGGPVIEDYAEAPIQLTVKPK